MLIFHGRWQITVVAKDAAFAQRAVVRTPRGTTVLEGRVGASCVADAPEWELTLEHSWGEGWHPNVRVLADRLTGGNGVRSQVLRSKDRDWQGDTAENDLVLRLDALEAEPSVDPHVASPAVRTTTAQDVTCTSGTVVEGRGEAQRAEEPGVPAAPAVRTTSVGDVPAAEPAVRTWRAAAD